MWDKKVVTKIVKQVRISSFYIFEKITFEECEKNSPTFFGQIQMVLGQNICPTSVSDLWPVFMAPWYLPLNATQQLCQKPIRGIHDHHS